MKNDRDILTGLLANILGGMQPPQMPQIEQGSSFIIDTLINWKLKRMQTCMERRSAIYEHFNNMLNTQLEIIKTNVTLPDQMEAAKASVIIAVKNQEAELQIRLQQLEQEKIKTNTMITEFKTNELTYQKMQKELEYDSSAKDR